MPPSVAAAPGTSEKQQGQSLKGQLGEDEMAPQAPAVLLVSAQAAAAVRGCVVPSPSLSWFTTSSCWSSQAQPRGTAFILGILGRPWNKGNSNWPASLLGLPGERVLFPVQRLGAAFPLRYTLSC